MKTLAPFVIVCLGLLALVTWELNSATRNTAPDAELPPPERALQPSPTNSSISAEDPELLGESKAGETTLPQEPERHAGDRSESPTAPATQVVPAEPQPPPPAATQPAIRWATDTRRQEVEERLTELREVLAAEPYHEAVLKAAQELARELRRYDEACELLARLVRLRPQDAALRFELATLLMRLERWLDAIPQLRLVIEREPKNARAWYNLAIAHQALGHLHDARVTWNRAIEFMPENPDVYAQRGEVLLDLHAWSAAAADFQTALRLEPRSIDAAMNLSLALGKLGRLDDARAALLPVIEQHPQYVPALNRLAELAWALYQADPVAAGALSDETVNYCLRSLAVNADQPDVQTLLDRASQAGP
ncbi:MAG: tetratricopeptide repeat protein [Phycisphaerae bacterium]